MRSTKRTWYLPLLLGVALTGATALAEAEQIFRDDFNRYAIDVGNGWAQMERDYDDVYCFGLDASTAVLQLRDRRDDDEPDAAVSRLISTVGYTDVQVHVLYAAFSWSTQFWSDSENPYPDLLKVQYTVDGGSTWSTAGSKQLMSTSWSVYIVSLPADANGQANFGIRLASDLDESRPEDLSQRGMLIDYVLVEGTPAPDTTPPAVSINKPADVVFPADAIVTATATDSESNIRSAEYSRDGTAWASMSATDGAFDAKSEDLKGTLSGLLVKTYEVCVRATDINDKTSDGNACDTFDVTVAQLDVAFAGQLLDVDGPQTELKAEVTGPCSSGAGVEFFVDSGSGYALLGTATTDISGVATLNADLAIGIHDIKVEVEDQDLGGDNEPECKGDNDSGITVVADPNAASSGGGWYRIDGVTPPRVNFGYAANVKYNKKTQEFVTTGNLLWMNQDNFKLKGAINQSGKLVCPTSDYVQCAVFAGTGILYEHNDSYDPLDDPPSDEWAGNSPLEVSFVATVYDGGSSTVCQKKRCTVTERPDAIMVQINGASVPAAPNEIITLQGGSITVKK